jgi:hypothetical protein
MNRNYNIKNIVLLVGFVMFVNLNQAISQQSEAFYVFGKKTIGASPTLFVGNITLGNSGELFLGDHHTPLSKTNRFFKIGNYKGISGAKLHISVADNNNHETYKLFDIVGTASGSTEIVLDMHNDWDGSRINLVRAHNTGSDTTAFTMEDEIYNGRNAYLATEIVGNDRIWYLAERMEVEEGECLPVILQKRNTTLVIDNNALNNGGYDFAYYQWYRNDELVHEGAHGIGMGGIYNIGDRNITLNPNDTYHAILIDRYGKEHHTCPYNPTIFIPKTEIIGYPNPATTSQPLIAVEVKTNDEDLLIDGVIIVYTLLGQQIKQVRTNGHRITPIQLPATQGTYICRFISGNVMETMRIIVTQ